MDAVSLVIDITSLKPFQKSSELSLRLNLVFGGQSPYDTKLVISTYVSKTLLNSY